MVADIKPYRQAHLFYSLSIIIPWVFWGVAAYLSHEPSGRFLALSGAISLLGLLAPLAIALILILPNDYLRKDFLGRIFNLNSVPSEYLLLAVFLMPVSILIAQSISLLFGFSADQFQFRGGYTFSSGIFPVWFLLILAPTIEELAWHSYGTDCLRSRFNLMKTSLLFALFWGIWHLPLSFIKDYYHSNLIESGIIYSVNFLVSLFPFVIIMNWLYYNTNRNILVSIIFHISAGYFNEIFATDPMSKVIQTGLLILLSIYLIKTDNTFLLNTK